MSQRTKIIDSLKEKSAIKQDVYDTTQEVFLKLKEILQEYAVEANELIEGVDKRVKMIYQDRGKLEVQLQVAGDILLFSMHSNIFKFDRSNPIWENPYIKENPLNGYCGVIHIYNFLADSFKYNRVEDHGYLIGRIFINRQMQYIVEGKRQLSARHADFGSQAITAESLIEIIENTILYAINEFELLVPPYDLIKMITLGQVNSKIESTKLQTGKRLGYQFRSDDI
ncbi:MAG: hypothetical protein R3Y19_07565 [Rikenellaceae bacterium]